jgi:hypothetical protein
MIIVGLWWWRTAGTPDRSQASVRCPWLFAWMVKRGNLAVDYPPKNPLKNVLTASWGCAIINNVSGTPQQFSYSDEKGTMVGGFKNQFSPPKGYC